MRELTMVDLKSQYQNIKPEIDDAIQNVIDGAQFIKGPAVIEFQNKLADYLKVKHVIACANGTDALQIAMMALDLKPGDEVITTNFTFIATVEVIALLGLKPVLVDVDPRTFNMDVKQLENAITTHTKAIVPVHLFGQCVNMEFIMDLAKRKNIFVIEDNAQAIGADYTFKNGQIKKAGAIGDIGTTSFFPSKNLGCYGDGGALFTNNDELADKIRMIVNHGMKKRYYHDIIGVNSRLDSLQAAILNVKLPLLDKYCSSRNSAASFYNESLQEISEIETPYVSDYSNHVFHQYTLKVRNGKRDALKKYLDEQGVPSMIYYPVPLHEQNAFSKYKSIQEFPVTQELSKSVISLPMHTELDQEQLDYIVSTIKEFFIQ